MYNSRDNCDTTPTIPSTDSTAGSLPWETSDIRTRRNLIANIGFALSMLALVLGWIPMLGWVLWLGGLICSLIGLARQPRWSAVAGLVTSVTVMVMAMCISAIGSRAVFSFFSMMAR